MELNQELGANILYLVIGLIGGIVNSLASGASVFILSILLFMGLPANVANGTNCLGIFLQNLTGCITFFRSKLLDVRESLRYMVPSIAGSLIGVNIAIDLKPALLDAILGSVMVVMLVLILLKTGRKTGRPLLQHPFGPLLTFLIFFAIGIYSGFIPAGIGLIVMVVLSKISSLTMLRASAVKMSITLMNVTPVFLVFIYHGHVDWLIALWLAGGQVLGAWFAGKYLVRLPHANIMVKWLLVVMILVSIFKVFGIINLAVAWLL
jgi:uncharacterized membrane protein YfcA